VLARLSAPQIKVAGELLLVAGNVGAIQENRRFRARDLNRVWTDAGIAALGIHPDATGARPALDAEQVEMIELLAAINGAIARARGPVYLIDLHTTSAAGVPFAVFAGTASQRVFAGAFPLPVIVNFEKHLIGVLSLYWTRYGVTTLAVEGGQHEDPGTIDNLEAALLVGAEAAGIIAPGTVAAVEGSRRLLDSRRADLPRVMEVISRHAITPEDSFKMEPGFRNLDYARAAQLLARDRTGEIRAPGDGLVILPLYQGQGEDGFFWGRELAADHLTEK
jgi:succinylglutamate desuccinylase